MNSLSVTWLPDQSGSLLTTNWGKSICWLRTWHIPSSPASSEVLRCYLWIQRWSLGVCSLRYRRSGVVDAMCDSQLMGEPPSYSCFWGCKLMFLGCRNDQTQYCACGSNFTNHRSDSVCSHINSIYFSTLDFVIMFPTVFGAAIKASSLFGDVYRQLLNADTGMRVWKYEIDTIVVTKHNRRLLWRGKCFEYQISL